MNLALLKYLNKSNFILSLSLLKFGLFYYTKFFDYEIR
jgi:hypothetical protein